MPKKQHPLLFVDTNIFLDFYRVEGEAGLTLLNHLGSVSDLLIITDQIEVEFLNNRQKVVSEVLKNVRVPTVSKLIPAYLADTKTAAALARNVSLRQTCVSGYGRRIGIAAGYFSLVAAGLSSGR